LVFNEILVKFNHLHMYYYCRDVLLQLESVQRMTRFGQMESQNTHCVEKNRLDSSKVLLVGRLKEKFNRKYHIIIQIG
jgi:hypothetical protein